MGGDRSQTIYTARSTCRLYSCTDVYAPTFQSSRALDELNVLRGRRINFAKRSWEDIVGALLSITPTKGVCGPLWNPRSFRAASTNVGTYSYFGALLYGSGSFDCQRDYPMRVSDRDDFCSHRSSSLHRVLMQTFTHQSHTAVGRGMCNSNQTVRDIIKPVPHVYLNVQELKIIKFFKLYLNGSLIKLYFWLA